MWLFPGVQEGSSIMRANSPEASWECLRTPLRGFLEVRFWKNPARAGPGARATLALALPARIDYLACLPRNLDSLLFCFSTFPTKKRDLGVFSHLGFRKNPKTFGVLSKKGGVVVPGWSFCYLVGWEDNNTGVWVSKVWNPARNLRKAVV